MYDHKFRQSGLSFGQPSRRRRKPWWWLLGAGLAVAVVYGLLTWESADQTEGQPSVSAPNIIPLPLPPKVQPEPASSATGER